jgi:single-stranded-DNA-specific exonuclease
MKAKHLSLQLTQASAATPAGESSRLPVSAAPISSIRAVGWNLAERAFELGLAQGSIIDLAYRIRENDHPDFGGLEIEILGMRPAAFETLSTPVAEL